MEGLLRDSRPHPSPPPLRRGGRTPSPALAGEGRDGGQYTGHATAVATLTVPAAGLLLGLLFVGIWASAFNAARIVVLDWPALWALDIRFLIVAPLLALIVAWRRAPIPSPEDRARLALMGLFGTAGYLACAWLALRGAPSGLVALLSATAPLFVALGERLLRGRAMSASAWAGLLLGWCGVAILGGFRAADGFDTAEAWGIALALLGAVSQAIGILCFAPARGRVDPWMANAGQSAVTGLALLPLALALEPLPPAAIRTATLLALLWSILVVGIAGYALFFVMMRRLPASTAASLQLLSPPFAALFDRVLLGERLLPTDLAGGAVTLAGIALLLRARGG